MPIGATFEFPPGSAGRWSLLALAILAIAMGLRLASAAGDFWLDEIVSLNLARQYPVSEIVVGSTARHDNNHVLNTIYLRAVADAGNELAYRALSIASGVAAVALMGWIGFRQSRRAGLLAAFLGSFAYILVHYGSEARGYALASALALGAWIVVDRDLARPRAATRVALAIAVALGYLAHYSFGFVYAGIVGWTALHGLRGTAPWRSRLSDFVALNAAPAAITLAIYFGHVRPMHLAGGPEFGVGWALWSALGETLGFQFHPAASLGARLAPLLALGLLVAECINRAREGREDVAFYGFLFATAGFGTIFVIRPEFVVPRYFVVAVPFALILFASLLDRGFGSGWPGRAAAALLLAFMIGGSAGRDVSLIRGGRGHYRDAVEFMADQGAPVVRVTGTDSRWVRVLIEGYYGQFRPDVRFEVLESERAVGGAPADWYLHNTWARDHRPPAVLEPGEGGSRYRFVKHYPFSSLSGWHWYLYRLER